MGRALRAALDYLRIECTLCGLSVEICSGFIDQIVVDGMQPWKSLCFSYTLSSQALISLSLNNISDRPLSFLVTLMN